jgi:hypothetical protein
MVWHEAAAEKETAFGNPISVNLEKQSQGLPCTFQALVVGVGE